MKIKNNKIYLLLIIYLDDHLMNDLKQTIFLKLLKIKNKDKKDFDQKGKSWNEILD